MACNGALRRCYSIAHGGRKAHAEEIRQFAGAVHFLQPHQFTTARQSQKRWEPTAVALWHSEFAKNELTHSSIPY
jgi:hypothetical protein